MSAADLARAAKTRAPAPGEVRLYTCDTSPRCNALPRAWAGQYVAISNEGEEPAHYYVSRVDGAVVDWSIVASEDGATEFPAWLGDAIPAGQSVQVLLPRLHHPDDESEALYLARSASESCPLRVRLA